MIASRRSLASVAGLAAGGVLLSSWGCTIPENWGAKSPQEHLVETLLTTWASPGHRFLEGVVGADTIQAVKETGDRSRQVTLPGRSALGNTQDWTLEITKADVLPVHSGQAFVKWLATRSAATGERVFLPADVASLLTQGAILSVGDVEATYGRSDRSGRSTVKRVAYLRAGAKGKDPEWVLQPETHTPVMLRDLLVRVYADMIRRDDSVLTCLGEAERGADARTTQLKCIKNVIDLQFR